MPDRSPVRPQLGRESPSTVAVILDDPAWQRALPAVARTVGRAAAACGGAGTVMLSSDRAVRALNRQHRGIDRPTNVLSFQQSGDIVLAYGTVRREAGAARRRLDHHLAHLVVHGMLHVHGEDHGTVSQARRMEQHEARILHRLRVPNPWKPSPGPSSA